MTASFQLDGSGVRRVAATMRDQSDLAARAGTALAGLADPLGDPGIGERLAPGVGQFATLWCEVIDDLLSSLAELASWMDQAVTCYFSVDSDVSYRLGGLHP